MSKNIINEAIKPRVITQFILVVIFGGLGYVSFSLLPEKTLAWLSSLAAPFCAMCAASVWAMRERFEDIIPQSELKKNVFQGYIELIELHRKRSRNRTVITFVMAFTAAVPAVVTQFELNITVWMAITSGAAVGVAIYSYLIANSWDAQARAYKNKMLLKALGIKEKEELDQKLNKANNYKDVYTASVGNGWKESD